MSIPQKAIDRFMMLQGKADALYAARMEAQRAWEHEWNETNRLEGTIRSFCPNQHLEIDDTGLVAVVQRHRGNPHAINYATVFRDDFEKRTILRLDNGTRQRVQLLLSARHRLRQAEAHRQRLNSSGNGLLQLVEACQKELQRRGWAPSGTTEVRL